MKRIGLVIAALIVGAGAVACGPPTTSLTQVWQAETPRTPFGSMLVFAVRMDEANRRVLEDTFVADLQRRGVRAAPSYVLFPGELPPMDAARRQVSEAHYEGILVLKLRGVRDETRYVPTATGFWSGYYGGWGYYGSPGSVVTDETVIFETTLWDLRAEDRLLWTARTETLNPTNGTDFAISLKRAVNPELTKQGLLPRRRRRTEAAGRGSVARGSRCRRARGLGRACLAGPRGVAGRAASVARAFSPCPRVS